MLKRRLKLLYKENNKVKTPYEFVRCFLYLELIQEKEMLVNDDKFNKKS